MGEFKPNITNLNGVGGMWQIYNILQGLFITSFKWKGLPTHVNTRFMELALFDYGCVAFFQDEVSERYVALKAMQSGPLDLYYEPTGIIAYGGNGVQKKRTNHVDCEIIYNNYVRDTPQFRIMEYAKRIHDLELTIDINVHAQRTPILIKTSKKQELTVKNMYAKYDKFEPVIVVDNEMDSKLEVLSTKAEFVARHLMDLKKQIWNEALSYIGIENNSAEKNERLTDDEVLVSNGMAIASRNTRLEARQDAAERINQMFGLSISVEGNTPSLLGVSGEKGMEEKQDE